MKKSITQEDPFGCGIACVAWITNKSYKGAKKKYFKDKYSAHIFGYLCKDLVAALAKSKKRYSYKYIKGEIRFHCGSIVFIKRSKRYPAGHYLVKTRKGWVDPWINFNYRNANLKMANSGFRKRLPGKPIYVILPRV